MIKRILNAIGFGNIAMATSCSHPFKQPYENEGAQLIYDLLFCDRLELFRDNFHGEPTGPWSTLFSQDADIDGLRAIAEDDSQESRVRMLAFNRLRAVKQDVPEKILLGTIVEVYRPEGLDTLAVFADGSVRYINRSGKMAVVEDSLSEFSQEIQAVLKAAQPIVDAIGPWDKNRLPPPNEGNIRMTFLVSDSLYFGEGPMAAVQTEQMVAPLINAATALLLKLVGKTT